MLKKFYTHCVFIYPRSILFFILLLVSFLGYSALSLQVDASADTLLLEDDKDLAYSRLISERYKTPEFLVITYTPKQYLLDPQTISHIQALSDALVKLDLVTSVTSINNIPFLQSPPRPVKELVDHIPTIQGGDVNLTMAKAELLSNPLYLENFVSKDFKTTALLINLKYDETYNKLLSIRNDLRRQCKEGNVSKKVQLAYEASEKSFKTYKEKVREEQHQNILDIRSIIKKHQTKSKMFLGGVNMIVDDLITFVKNDLKTYGVIVLILLILAFYFIFKAARWVFIPVVTLFASIIASMGLLSLFGFEITVISSNYISLQLILTTSIIIHLIVRYKELIQKFPSQAHDKLILHTVISMSRPTFFAVITTIAGFSSLVLSGILPVIQLGWMMSLGLIISFIMAYTLFPAILILMKPILTIAPKHNTPSFTKALAHVVVHKASLIYLSTFIIILFSLYGVFQLRVENSFISYFKSSSEIYKGMKVIDQQLGGTTPLDITIDFVQEEQVDVQEEEDEDSFFDEFEDEFEESKNDAQYWFTEDKMQTITAVHNYLESVPELGKALSFATMLKVGKSINDGEDLDNLELALLYKELPQEFADLIVKPYLNIDNNQARFNVRIVDSNPDLRRNDLLIKVKTELSEKVGIPAENVHLSGMMVLYNNMLQSLYASLC